MFRLPSEYELDKKWLDYFITEHEKEVKRYQELKDAYETDYEIFHLPKKKEYKPDNRIAVNFAKYIVDTFNGFFMGIPVRVESEDDTVANYVEFLSNYNDQDDANSEISKMCDIYGKAYEMYYIDEDSKNCTIYLSPIDAFMIYDDSILERPRAFVRLYKDIEDIVHGSVSYEDYVRYFKIGAGVEWSSEEPKLHGYDGVPATEFRENKECIGIFQPVMSMINAYNKTISDKQNDIDYFADAYLKIFGPKLTEENIQQIRDSRVLNFDSLEDAKNIVAEFMEKPDGDNTQEHQLDRLEKLIFMISMVANISDENFGTSSGIALKYKLLAMSNLAKSKARKFQSGMNRRYKLLFSNPLSGMKKDDWVKITYKFTENIPANLLEESQIAQNLSGITSQFTQLKSLSIVDNVQKEMDLIKEENEELKKENPGMEALFKGVVNGQSTVLEGQGSEEPGKE